MEKRLHEGEFIKAVLEEHDKILARIARKASMSPQNLSGVFKRMRVDADIIERISEAAKLDIGGMLRAATDKATGKSRPSPVNVAEPPAEYKRTEKDRPTVVVLSSGDPQYAEFIRSLIERNG